MGHPENAESRLLKHILNSKLADSIDKRSQTNTYKFTIERALHICSAPVTPLLACIAYHNFHNNDEQPFPTSIPALSPGPPHLHCHHFHQSRTPCSGPTSQCGGLFLSCLLRHVRFPAQREHEVRSACISSSHSAVHGNHCFESALSSEVLGARCRQSGICIF